MQDPQQEAALLHSPARRLPFETASVIRLIRAFIRPHTATTSTSSTPSCEAASSEESDLPSLEKAGMLLWDLSADEDAAPALLQLQLLPAIAMQLAACTSGAFDQRPPAASQPHTGRVVELCCGILANLASCPGPHVLLFEEVEELQALLPQLPASLDDPAALSELCRLLAAALSTPQGAEAWLPRLQQHHQLAWLVQVLANTLHPQLLERALQLAAALLAASSAQAGAAEDGDAACQVDRSGEDAAAAAAATEVEGAAATHEAMAAQLLQAGLLEALVPILAVAAADGAAQLQRQRQQPQQEHDEWGATAAAAPATAAAGEGGTGAPDGSGWSEDEDDAAAAAAATAAAAVAELAAGAGNAEGEAVAGAGAASPRSSSSSAAHDQRLYRLYRQPAVLLATAGLLEQLGQDGAGAADAQRRLPRLPLLLLQLLAACSSAGQQEVVEVLLLALVGFRAGVLAALGPAQGDQGPSGQQQQDKQQQEHQQQQQQQQQQKQQQQDKQEQQQSDALWYLSRIATALQDCTTPDSLDAAWFLLAAGAQQVCVQQQLPQQLAHLGQSSQLPVGAATAQLQRLCECVARATVPDTALRYARVVCQVLQATLEGCLEELQLAAAAQDGLRRCSGRIEQLVTLLERRQPADGGG